tara:strand:+ start:17514 stop:18485 length:972 start_codon:yes stop_codon:yes gene_type:complete
MFWGDCELVFNKEDKIFKPVHHKPLLAYMSTYKEATNENIWLDHEVGKYFSAAQTLSIPNCGQDHHFISARGNYINNTYPRSSAWMLAHYQTLKNNFKAMPEVVNTEIKCGYCDSIKDIHNQGSVFIIGGGPSTNTVDFSKFKSIPKWTMNSYFLNDKINTLENIQLVTFLDNVNLDDENMWDRLNILKPLLIQEISDLGNKRINFIRNRYDNATYMHTRYRSRLGVGARLIVLAIVLGIKNIYISGMDGYDVNSTQTHAFEKGKELPTWLKNSGPSMQKQQLVIFWDYILNTLSKSYSFKIHDLSTGQETVQYKFIQEAIIK